MSTSTNSSFCDGSKSGRTSDKSEYTGKLDGMDPDGVEYTFAIVGTYEVIHQTHDGYCSDAGEDDIRTSHLCRAFRYTTKDKETEIEDFLSNPENFEDDGEISYDGEAVIKEWIAPKYTCGGGSGYCNATTRVTITSASIVKMRQENLRNEWLQSIRSKKLRVRKCVRCKEEHDQTEASLADCSRRYDVLAAQRLDRRIAESRRIRAANEAKYRSTSSSTVRVPTEQQVPRVKPKLRVPNWAVERPKNCRYKDTPWLCTFHAQGRCKFHH